MPRFTKCPKCLGTDVEIVGNTWLCYDCDWIEDLNQEEKDNATESEE